MLSPYTVIGRGASIKRMFVSQENNQVHMVWHYHKFVENRVCKMEGDIPDMLIGVTPRRQQDNSRVFYTSEIESPTARANGDEVGSLL